MTPEGELSLGFGFVPWRWSSSTFSEQLHSSSWELTALLKGKLPAVAVGRQINPFSGLPNRFSQKVMKAKPRLTRLPEPLNYSVCQKRCHIDSRLHPLTKTCPCLLRIESFQRFRSCVPASAPTLSNSKICFAHLQCWCHKPGEDVGQAPAGSVMKRYENLTMGWLRGVNAFKLMPAPELLFFFCVSACWYIVSLRHMAREIRGGGREEKRERKGKKWPATELNQTLEQLSRPQYIKTCPTMTIQLHDNVTKLAAVQHSALPFWHLQHVCLTPTFTQNCLILASVGQLCKTSLCFLIYTYFWI